jgi:altronate dehydratase large subunit
MKFKGYIREDGLVGVRNLYLVLGVCDAVEGIVRGIAREFDDVITVTSAHGCPAAGNEQVINNMAGLANNPNVVGVLIIGIGCEGVKPEMIIDLIDTKKPVAIMEVVNEKGTRNTIERGIGIIKDMQRSFGQPQRELVDIAKLTVGVKCGGSDTTSGIAANSSVGAAVDKLVDWGATVLFTEPIECIGGEAELMARAANQDVANQIKETISLEEKRWTVPGTEVEFMCIGNITGGLSTIEEKSLGAIHKSGSRPIQGVLEYSDRILERPKKSGVYLQDGTMLFSHCLTHLAAAGCQLLIFTTGIGASVSSQLLPTIRVCGNPDSYRKMIDDMDINAGTIIEGTESINTVGEKIVDKLIKVAGGEKTSIEDVGYSGFAIYKTDPRVEYFIQRYMKQN